MKRFLGMAVLSLLLVSGSFVLRPRPLGARPDPTIGDAPVGKVAVEFVCKYDQQDNLYTYYGYFTHVSGLPDSSLFTNPSQRNETTARFTCFGQATITAHHAVQAVLATAAPGTITYYFNEQPAGDFNNPSSFAQGLVIATSSLRLHTENPLIQPNEGVPSARGDLTQLTNTPFLLDGRRVHFGRHGMDLQLGAAGRASRTQVAPLLSSGTFAGRLVTVHP
jgi:hypothetical protein